MLHSRHDNAKPVYLVCNAHLDPVWQWPWEDGCAEALSTFHIAADFCDQYPDFVFVHNETLLYQWIQRYQPALHQRIRRLIDKGQWRFAGGAYLQPDCNAPGSESMIRMFLIARPWCVEQFGQQHYPRTAYNFDPFGHPEGMPQILAGCGMQRYVFCRPDLGTWPLPVGAFVWSDRTGTAVIARRSDDHYHSSPGISDKLQRFTRHYADEPVSMILWGIGNHGGGPNHDQWQQIQRFFKDHTEYQPVHGDPDDFFDSLLAQNDLQLTTVTGEFQNSAPGCYTSMARIKRLYRKTEHDLLAYERQATAAWWSDQIEYPQTFLTQAWQTLLFNSFHDILPGSCSPTGEQDALNQLGGLQSAIRRQQMDLAMTQLADAEQAVEGQTPVFVRNPHAREIHSQVEVDLNLAHSAGACKFARTRVRLNGRQITHQRVAHETGAGGDWRVRLVVPVKLAPLATQRLNVSFTNAKTHQPVLSGVPKADDLQFANKQFELTLDVKTGLIRHFGIPGRQSLLAPRAGAPALFKDAEHSWVCGDPRKDWGNLFIEGAPGWDAPDCVMQPATPEQVNQIAPLPLDTWQPCQKPRARALRIIEQGPLRTVVEAIFIAPPSWCIRQYIVMHQPAALEIRDRYLFAHPDHMLKCLFPFNARIRRTVTEALASAIERNPTDTHEDRPQQRWVVADTGTEAGMLAVVDTNAFGHSCTRDTLALNVCRSPAYAMFTANDPDKPRLNDRAWPRMDMGIHQVNRRLVPMKKLDETLLADTAELLIRPPQHQVFFPHPDTPTDQKCQAHAFQTNRRHVRLESLKREATGERLICRFRETAGRKTNFQCSLPHVSRPIDLTIGKWQLLTIAVDRKTGRYQTVNLVEQPI